MSQLDSWQHGHACAPYEPPLRANIQVATSVAYGDDPQYDAPCLRRCYAGCTSQNDMSASQISPRKMEDFLRSIQRVRAGRRYNTSDIFLYEGIESSTVMFKPSFSTVHQSEEHVPHCKVRLVLVNLHPKPKRWSVSRIGAKRGYAGIWTAYRCVPRRRAHSLSIQ